MSNVIALKKPRAKKIPDLLQLKIELACTKPTIWRRILVPESITLGNLHKVLQVTFGWCYYHLHEFDFGGERFGIPDREFDWEPVRPIELKSKAQSNPVTALVNAAAGSDIVTTYELKYDVSLHQATFLTDLFHAMRFSLAGQEIVGVCDNDERAQTFQKALQCFGLAHPSRRATGPRPRAIRQRRAAA